MIFSDLGLSPEILDAVANAGYQTPTPIQEKAIPIILQGRDVLGCAQTGTGKTAAFTLPMIEILASGRAKARMPRSLILTPTRELATQISENFEMYGQNHKLSMALLIGGVSFDEQFRKLDRGVDVLVATPGRLLDHFGRGRVMLHGVKVLVIDESDRMLDMGFMPDVERIVGLLPPIRQTLFFSATMPREIRRLADAFLSNPKEITVDPPTSTAENVVQALAVVAERDKVNALRRLIDGKNVKNALIFCNRKKDVDVLARSLKSHGYEAAALHGDMIQSLRTSTLEGFKQGRIRLLVATDVAGRGIDIEDLSHVFNFDVPFNPEDYIHRVGRTGRAGKVGHAFTIATPADGGLVAAVIALIGKEIPAVEVDAIATQALEADDGRRRRGGRAPGRRPRENKADARPPRREHKSPTARRDQSSPAPAAGGEDKAAAPPARPEKKADARPPRRANKADRPRRSQQAKQGNNAPVVGMGDHVPAFLMAPLKKPARPAKKSAGGKGA